MDDLNFDKSKYFTKEEILEFKQGSLPFPWMIYDGNDPNNVVEVNEVVCLGGMATNNGIPDEITIYRHVKGQEKQRLVYKLVQQ